jgi:hypothetical protein
VERPDRTVTTWRKSTYSGSNGSDCVEVGTAPNSVLVRDTKNRASTTLTTTPTAWTRFAASLK